MGTSSFALSTVYPFVWRRYAHYSKQKEEKKQIIVILTLDQTKLMLFAGIYMQPNTKTDGNSYWPQAIHVHIGTQKAILASLY